MPFYESQPAIYPLYRLLEEVLRGEIQVPRFQRPGTEATWGPTQRGDLLDSIHRGYPIGTILLWSTKESVRTLEIVGGARIPTPPNGQRLRLILDGHQRLSSLIAIMGSGLQDHKAATEAALDENWIYDLSDDTNDSFKPQRSRRERFVLLKSNLVQDDKYLPLPISLDRVKLNEWLRERPSLSSQEVARADALRDRFREYNLPVASLVTESLDEATESFYRINKSGTPMDPFHMVTALAYTDGFDPQEAFSTIRANLLEPEGWAELGDADMLRVCAGLVRRVLRMPSQHPAKFDIRSLAQTLREHPSIIDRTGEALAATLQLLRRFGIHGPGILPYGWQLIVLAIEAGSRESTTFDPQDEQALEKWFWLTTYGEVFGGVNAAVVDRASKAMGEMLRTGGWEAMRRDATQQVEEPKRSDFRAARSRGLILQMARQSDQDRPDGDKHRALVYGTMNLRTLVPKRGRSTWFNLVIEPDLEQLRRLRTALRNRVAGNETADDNASLDAIAIEASDRGSVDELLECRRTRLLMHEKRFVEELGLAWSDGGTTES